MKWPSQLIIFLLLSSLGAVSAQVPYVPAEFLDTRIRLQGDHVTTCVFDGRDTSDFDRAAANLVADALLITHDTVGITTEFPIYAEEDFYSDIYQRLVNDCDLIAGLSLATDGLPDWLAITSAYAELPFVVITRDDSYRTLGDVPRDQAVGVQMGSLADMNFLTWYTSVQPDQRWQRIPYADTELMLSRLDDGTIAAAILWLPNLVTVPQWEQGEYTVIGSAPVQETTVQTGFVALTNQTWLQGQIDAAINALRDSGALRELAGTHGLNLPDND